MLYSALVVLCLSGSAAAGRVLAVLPLPYYSHAVPFFPTLVELTARGHDVTLISPYDIEPRPPRYTHILTNHTLSGLKEIFRKKYHIDVTNPRAQSGLVYETNSFYYCPPLSIEMTEAVKPLLPDPATVKVDLIIAEIFFCQEPLAALGHIYQAPIVVKHPGPLIPSVAYMLGNPSIASYTPHVRLVHTDHMNLLERTWNLLISTYDEFMYNIFFLPGEDKIMRGIFNDVPDLPYVGDLLRNIALLMTETHFALNYPRPYARNILEVGSLGSRVPEPLPKDLEKYINDSKSGVIYMSWGSHFQSDKLNETLASLMKVFAQLDQRVLFKWHVDIPGRPENVLIRKWFPQNSILGHEKTVLYISHCGMNSIYEAGFHGVPVLGTPIFLDQPHNALILKQLGMAEIVDFDSLVDGHSLLSTIRTMTTNPRYKESAGRRSELLRDRPVPVLTEVVSWLEFVMRHGGDALRPAMSSLPWYSRLQLDTIGLLAGLLTALLLILLRLGRICLRAIKPKEKRE